MKKVILLSGGIDSTTCLTMAVNLYGADNVIALNFLYGQKHANEIENARKVAEHFSVKLVEARIDSQIFQNSTSTLLKGNGDIAHKA